MALANIFGYFDAYLYELDEFKTGIYEVLQKENPKPVDDKIFKKDFDDICGCLTSNKFFAEEIAADAFMICFEIHSDPELLIDCSAIDSVKIRKIIQLIRN